MTAIAPMPTVTYRLAILTRAMPVERAEVTVAVPDSDAGLLLAMHKYQQFLLADFGPDLAGHCILVWRRQ